MYRPAGPESEAEYLGRDTEKWSDAGSAPSNNCGWVRVRCASHRGRPPSRPPFPLHRRLDEVPCVELLRPGWCRTVETEVFASQDTEICTRMRRLFPRVAMMCLMQHERVLRVQLALLKEHAIGMLEHSMQRDREPIVPPKGASLTFPAAVGLLQHGMLCRRPWSGNAILNFFKWWYQKDGILDLFPEMVSVKISLQLLVSATQLEVLDMECSGSLLDSEKLNSNEKQMYVSTKIEASHGVTGSVLDSLWTSKRLKKVIRAGISVPSDSSAPSRGAEFQKDASSYDHEALYKEERRSQYERLSRNRSSSAKTTPPSPPGPPATVRSVDHGSGASSNMREARSVLALQLQRQQSETLPKRVFEVNTANFDKLLARSQVLENGQLSGKTVTGRVNTTLEVSIISITEAGRLDLNVISCEQDKETEFKFDQGKNQPCIGMVTFTIYHSRIASSQSPTTSHKVYVVEHCRPELIFGKNFFDRDGNSKQ
ncbi:hypothetical protein Landi51_01327 [Colletotrichum acutatum]